MKTPRRLSAAAGLTSFVAAFSCTEAVPPDVEIEHARAEKVVRAVELSQLVAEDDGRNLDVMLRENGLTQADVDKLMYEIALDPDLTDAYLRERAASDPRSPASAR
jgi:hypothetical protein